MPNSAYQHNHYVPEWYQKRFIAQGKGKYWFLDLKPEVLRRDGHRWTRKDLRLLGPKNCFAQDDLYTFDIGGVKNYDLEQYLFWKYRSQRKESR